MEAKSAFLQLFEKLESFADKLPSPLQAPIMRAATPLKDLFLKQRPPRLVLTGDVNVSQAGFFNAIFSAPVAPFEPEVAPALHSTGWQSISHPGRGGVQVLDARLKNRSAGENPVTETVAKSAFKFAAPDLFLFLQPISIFKKTSADQTQENQTENLVELLKGQLQALERLIELAESATAGEGRKREMIPVLGVVVSHEDCEEFSDAELVEAAEQLQQLLITRPTLALRLAPAQAVATFMRFRLDGSFDGDGDHRRSMSSLSETIIAELPDEAKLEMARLSGAKETQVKIAQTLINSVTAASGAVGLQPIPLADLPFLLAFQATMVSGIIYISGREMNLKLGSQFIASIGANVGAGLVLREGARALSKLVPGWGNAVSGLIAAGGTYAIGRAALAYYIEGVHLIDAKRIFSSQKKIGSSVMGFLTRRRHKDGASKTLELPPPSSKDDHAILKDGD